jgi:hypothetical protein
LEAGFCYLGDMATLREYFSSFQGLMVPSEQELTVQPLDGGPTITATARLYVDFSSHTRYISFFIGEGDYTPKLAVYLSQNAVAIVAKMSETLKVSTKHPAVHGKEEESDELPFSGRAFLFVDQIVPSSEKDELVSQAAAAKIALEIRDKGYAEYLSVTEKPRAFISHDSRDKPFVRGVAEKLISMRCPVWYDEFSLKVGDSLVESIEKGLKESAKCIVVLSPSFLSNPGWTKAEFKTAMHKHISSGGATILPIWHNVSRAEVEEYSPFIIDIVALKSDMDIDELVRKLFAAINPVR